MALNNQPLIFNLDKTYNLFNLNAKQYDTDNARGFIFYLIQNGKPFDLTGLTINIGGKKPDGKNIFNNTTIIDAIKGIIQIDLTTQMLVSEGILSLELIIIKDSTRLSSYSFEINVVPSITDFQSVQSSDEFGALQKALGDVNNITTNTIDIKALKDTTTNLANDIKANTDAIKTQDTEVTKNTKQIISNSNSISDIQNNWFSDCGNSLCINGFTSLKVYPQGVYYINGTAVTILESIDHSEVKNGQWIYFIAETCDQTANIKFPASLSSSGVFTPKGADFWITGRDNGDTIYIMQKIGGAMRFRSL